MKEDLAFNTTKIAETLEIINSNYREYKDSVASLEAEIQSLESKLSPSNNSIFLEFKEKFDEKKHILINAENMMKELIDILDNKNEELISATTNVKNNFE